jgi:hypothetical protein
VPWQSPGSGRESCEERKLRGNLPATEAIVAGGLPRLAARNLRLRVSALNVPTEGSVGVTYD